MANRISIVSLGCPKNLVDSDNLTRKLIRNGLAYIQSSEDADILLINTCGFIEDAKKESIEEILRLAKLKKGSRRQSVEGQRKIQNSKFKIQNSKRLIVFGCLAKRYKDELLKEIPEIDAIYGVGEENEIIEYCKSLQDQKSKSSKVQRIGNKQLLDFRTSSLQRFQSSYAYLKIADGCDKRCAYCVIPSLRGDYRSTAPDEIIKEAERHIKAGVKELILVAQDTACYGKDLNGYNISHLLRDICSINGDFWVRLLYVYPDSISDSLIDTISNEDKICKYLDIPFQHSEDRILRLMGRRGTRKLYLNLIQHIRRNIPNIAIRTTFIVGFPSETKDEFNSLIDFIAEVHFDRLGVFKYSKEEGTPASKLKGQISFAVKNKRFDTIMQHQARISSKKNEELIGKKFKAIVDEIKDGIAIGRLYSHAPEIDGVVIIESFKLQVASFKLRESSLVTRNSSLLKVGDFVTVKITDAYDYDLRGVIVK